MQIAVTGGTGYVGAHIVRALLAAHHSVRLQFRANRGHDELLRRLSDLGDVTPVEGDVRDPAAVAELLDGCDALVHAAGVVGTDNRQEELMWEINAYATESVMRLANDRGLDPIVSVSSYTALFPPPGPVIGPDTPPATGRSAYAKTKAYADRVARRMQSDGAPVVVTYPSSCGGAGVFHSARHQRTGLGDHGSLRRSAKRETRRHADGGCARRRRRSRRPHATGAGSPTLCLWR